MGFPQHKEKLNKHPKKINYCSNVPKFLKRRDLICKVPLLASPLLSSQMNSYSCSLMKVKFYRLRVYIAAISTDLVEKKLIKV
jgi:hypothetical protein